MYKSKNPKHQALIPQKLSPYLLDPQLPIWTLSNGTYQKSDLPRILTKLQYICVQSFIASGNNWGAMLRELGGTVWMGLRVLLLGGNNLGGVQGIGGLKADCLEVLFLDNNYIVSAKPFTHSNFPSLKHLSLQHNKLQSLQWLPSTNFPSLKLLNLKHNPHINYLSPILKMKANINIRNIDLGGVIRKHRGLVLGVYTRKSGQILRVYGR